MQFSGGPAPSRLWIGLVLLPVPALAIAAYVVAAPPHLEYRVDADRVIVDAALGLWDQGRVIARGQIRAAQAVDITHARRTAGTALPGYCNGRFSVDGHAAWAATDCGPSMVRLDTDDGVILVSPADRAAFVDAVTTAGRTGTFTPSAPPRRSAGLIALVVGPSLLLLVLLPLYLLRLSRPLHYRIEGGALVVPGALGEVRLPLAGATYRRGDPGRLWRLAGVGLPGLHLGWYRAFGGRAHLATSRTDDLVLVEGERRVVVSPLRTAEFLAALSSAGARPA